MSVFRLHGLSVTITVDSNEGREEWTLTLNENETIEEFMLRVAANIDEMTEAS